MLLLTQAQINNIKKAQSGNKGVTLKLSGKQIQANLKVEGGFLSLLAGLAATALPWLAKTILPGLATGLISSGVEKAITVQELLRRMVSLFKRMVNAFREYIPEMACI